MIKINLLPTELRKKKRAPFFDRITLYVILGLVAVGFLLWLQTKSQQAEISRLDDDIARLEAEIQRYSQQIKMVEEARELRDKMKKRMEAIQRLDIERPFMVKMFENFSAIMPDFVWVEEYREVEKVFTVVGRSYNLKGIANFIVGLIQSDYFDGIKLNFIREQSSGKEEITLYNFELSGNVLFESAGEYAGEFVMVETEKETAKPKKPSKGLIAKGREALDLDKDRAREAVSGLGK
ncbi:hypothetical protein DRQ36_07560 [bacterium]|nr:MAG: hypothetical protein DRQ36_07560 [bacterium]